MSPRLCPAIVCAALSVVSFTIDSPMAFAQPAVSTRITPAPSALGWNNSDVTVTFSCRGAVACPRPVAVHDEGSWDVTGTAVDDSGRESRASAVVCIDRTPPVVTIASPAASSSVEGEKVLVRAFARDTGSGVRAATCNGTPAAVQDNLVACLVHLHEAVNDVVVQVMDTAGNSGSAGLRVGRSLHASGPIIVPEKATILEGRTRAVQLVDWFGRSLPGATWEVSDPLVASIEEDGERVMVRALGPGQVTVTATWERQQVQASLTILPGPTLPMGTVHWAVAPRTGFVQVHSIFTHATPGGPDLFTIEREVGGRRALLKALSMEPEVLWVEAPAIREDEEIVDFMGETYGGVLLRVDAANGNSSAIVRAGMPTDGPLWRYQSPGRLSREFAQGHDGSVYVVETPADGFPHFLGLDGSTGAVRFRWPVPRAPHDEASDGCAGDVGRGEEKPALSAPSVPDGKAAALAFVTADEIPGGPGCVPQDRRFRRTLHLVRATGSGQVQVRALNAFVGAARSLVPDIRPLLVVPHYETAVLVPWVETAADGSIENHITRVEGDAITEYTLPYLGDVGIGGDTAYTVTADGRTLVVFEPVSGRVKYIKHALSGRLSVRLVTDTGGLIIHHTGPVVDGTVPLAPPVRTR